MKTVFNYIMSAIYLLTGLFLLLKGWFVLDRLQNYGLGILLIVYGIFRAYRIYSSVMVAKSEKEETENLNRPDLLS
jgi:hypothetical protein